MTIKCKKCGHQNKESQSVCSWCKTALVKTLKSPIDELLVRQQQLEIRHKKELDDLKKEILALKNQENFNAVPLAKEKEEKEAVKVQKSSVVVEDKAKREVLESPLVHIEETKRRTVNKDFAPKKPSELELKISKAIEPLYDGLDLVRKVYNKYKSEGKLPIFFMTIAGIIAILFGFGYLMQYTIGAAGIYQGLIKVSLGFVAALVSIYIGVRLFKRNESLKEYGSALISLGIVLNYVMIYYLSDLGNFPTLSNSLTGFLLIVANTGIAIGFALAFEAKIIAALFVLGGAFTPFYLNASGDGRFYYLYLWLLTVGASYVSIKINWKTLQYLSFAVSALMLQIVVFVQQPNSIVFSIYYHLFAYLFFYFTFFERNKLKTKLDKVDLSILAANLGLFSYNLFSAGQTNLLLLGITYLLNATIFIVLLLKVKTKIDKVGKLVFLVIIGLFIGLAIPSLFNQLLIGLFWAIEAVMLVYLGFLYSNELIRKEGYLLLAFSFVTLGWKSLEIVYSWNNYLWTNGLLNFVILGLVITLSWLLGQRFKESYNALEKYLFSLFAEVVPIWLGLIFFIISYGVVGLWSFPLAIVPLFGLIYWGKFFKTVTTVWFGYAHFLVLILGVLISIENTKSVHFSDQLLFAQFAIVILIISLWLLKSYANLIKLSTSSSSYRFSTALRVVFFCLLPLLFIHFVRKVDANLLPVAIWVSVLITYGLYRKLKYFALKIEIATLASIALLVAMSTLNPLGVSMGVLVLVAIVVLEKGYNHIGYSTSSLSSYLVAVPFFLAVLVWLLCFNNDVNQISFAFSSTGLFLILLVLLKNKLAFIVPAYIQLTNISILLLFFTFFANLLDGFGITHLMVISYLIILGILLGNKKGWFVLEQQRKRWNVTFVFHQVLILFCEIIVLEYLEIKVDGPLISVLIVVHAIVLIFIALKQHSSFINKVSMVLFILALLKILGNDISDFSMPQKVVVFLILGLLLLVASYGYVKLKKRFEVSDVKVTNPEEINTSKPEL